MKIPLWPGAEGRLPASMGTRVRLESAQNFSTEFNPGARGKTLTLHSDYPENADLWLTFTCGQDDSRKQFYIICRYDRDQGVTPCETILEGNVLKTKARAGDYFIMDTEAFLSALPKGE